MLNYLCTIVLLLMGKEMRRSNLTVHLTIRNIFDLLTESANSNILKITPPRPFGVSPSYPKRGQVENKSACSGGTGDLMKAFDNQGAVYVGAGSNPPQKPPLNSGVGLEPATTLRKIASFFSRQAIADDVANACDEAGVSYVQVHTGQPFTLLVPGNNDSTVRLQPGCQARVQLVE